MKHRYLLECLHFSRTHYCGICKTYREGVNVSQPTGEWVARCSECPYEKRTGQSENMAKMYSNRHQHPVDIYYEQLENTGCDSSVATDDRMGTSTNRIIESDPPY